MAGADPVAIGCGDATLNDLQATGFEAGSTTAVIPSATEIVAMGRALLWAEYTSRDTPVRYCAPGNVDGRSLAARPSGCSAND